MASISVWLGGLFIVGMILLGIVQSVDLPGPTLAGAATAVEPAPTQQELNLCLNGCMRGCVEKLSDETPCRAECDSICGVTVPE